MTTRKVVGDVAVLDQCAATDNDANALRCGVVRPVAVDVAVPHDSARRPNAATRVTAVARPAVVDAADVDRAARHVDAATVRGGRVVVVDGMVVVDVTVHEQTAGHLHAAADPAPAVAGNYAVRDNARLQAQSARTRIAVRIRPLAALDGKAVHQSIGMIHVDDTLEAAAIRIIGLQRRHRRAVRRLKDNRLVNDEPARPALVGAWLDGHGRNPRLRHPHRIQRVLQLVRALLRRVVGIGVRALLVRIDVRRRHLDDVLQLALRRLARAVAHDESHRMRAAWNRRPGDRAARLALLQDAVEVPGVRETLRVRTVRRSDERRLALLEEERHVRRVERAAERTSSGQVFVAAHVRRRALRTHRASKVRLDTLVGDTAVDRL